MKQNKEALLFFFSLGFLSIFFQTSLLKEIVWIFYGNEMFYGLGLGFWMLSAGIGSFYWKKMEKYFSILKINLWVILFSLILLNLFLVIFWRLVEAKIVVTGEIPGFFPLALIIFVSLFLFCFCLGMLFPWGVSNFKNRIKEAYFGETIGFLLGGILISIFTYKTFFPLNKSVEIWSLKFKFPKLEDVVKTKFNKILIIGKDNQKNFLTNGQVIFSSDQNHESEKRTSLIIPFSKKLNKVLVINSISMANSIIQNYPEEEVYLLENDLELVKLLEKEKGFIDFRTKILKEDAREFLRTSSKKWDLIALWGNAPQSLVENRFLTYEFFQNIQGKLADKGVFAFCFSFPSYYQGKEIFSFGKVIYQTIKEIFPFVKIICDEDFLIIIGSSERIDYNPEKILPKWREYFFYQIANSKNKELEHFLNSSEKKLNMDYEPKAFFLYQKYWQKIFNDEFYKGLLLILTFLFLAIGKIFKNFVKNKKAAYLGILVALSSFIMINLEILIIFAFQNKIGTIYQYLSLIFALALGGIALGVKFNPFKKDWSYSLTILFIMYGGLITLFLFFLKSNLSSLFWFWFFWIFIFGLLNGKIFATIADLCSKKEVYSGFLYAADLIGGSLGALVSSSLLIPIFGAIGILKFLILIDVIGIILIAKFH